MRIALLASGVGSNLRTILEHAASGRLLVEPVLVLSNNPEAGALEQARRFGVPVWSKARASLTREDFDRLMLEAINKAGAEAIILAGYMLLLSASFLRAFPGRILNIHPAVLPSFAGLRGGRDALDYQTRLSGCTVHFVEEEADQGPVIIQAAVPLAATDTLESLLARIQAMEHRIYPQAIKWLAQGRLKVTGRKVELLPGPGLAPGPGPVGAVGTVGAIGEGELGPWLVSPGLEDF